MARMAVKVTPKSNADEVFDYVGDELCVRVRSAPEGGRANSSACRAVAKFFGVSKSSVTVVRGETSRHKQVEISGMEEGDLVQALEDAGLLR